MFIKKGQKLNIQGGRGKGNYKGEAIADFDTEKDEWYPVKTLEYVYGCRNDWSAGDKIPCRNGIDKILNVIED